MDYPRYQGKSMNPLLKDMDRLVFFPCPGKMVNRGDVVVFRSPGDHERLIVHRVVHVDANGLRTRGDNNDHADPWTLAGNDILGRVKYLVRGKRRIPVPRGRTGQCFTIALRYYRLLKTRMFFRFGPLYGRLAHFGFCSDFRCFQEKLRVVSFQKPEGTELQLIMGRRAIGRRRPGEASWQIRRPFDLFVDKKALPDHPFSN